MSIPLRIVEQPPPAYAPMLGKELQPGDMWRDDWNDCRPGWAVVLPNLTIWHTWQPASDGSHWDVSGDAPVLTVSPSIFDHSPGREWHGWIRDGQLVDA